MLLESEGGLMVAVASRCRTKDVGSKSSHRDGVRMGGAIQDMAFNNLIDISGGF